MFNFIIGFITGAIAVIVFIIAMLKVIEEDCKDGKKFEEDFEG